MSEINATITQNILNAEIRQHTINASFDSGITINTGGGAGIDNSILEALAGENITSFKAVRLSNNQVFLFDYTDINQAGECIGISLSSALTGGVVQIKLFGILEVAQTLVNGTNYFAGINGILTNTAPTNGLIQRLGIAISTSQLLINLGEPIQSG